MIFKIHNIQELFFYLFLVASILYVSFKVFHYVYKDNYCDPLSATVIENTQEEFSAMKLCVYTLVCEIGEVKRSIYNPNTQGNPMVRKEFTCIRKNQAGTWK